jgi:hypothetical protein
MDTFRATVPCGEANIKPGRAARDPRRPGCLGAVDTTQHAPHNPADRASAGCEVGDRGECPERQRGRTVNPLADAFVGSSPTSPTILKIKDNPSIRGPVWGRFSCRVCCKIFSRFFNGSQSLPETRRNMNATYARLDSVAKW